MNKLSVFRSVILFVYTLVIISCGDSNKNSPPVIDPAFTGYISAFTSGVISNESTIQVRLREACKDADLSGPISKELFDFSPDIDGQAYWVDNRTIEFRPDERLPSGKLFDAEFYLSNLMEVPNNLKTLVFQFQTMNQALFVHFDGIKAYDNKDLKWQQVMGVLQTADKSDVSQVELAFSAMQNGKRMNITWEHEENGKNHNFSVDSILRTEEKQEVILQWNGEPVGTEDEGEQVVEIPPLGDFKVINTTVNQQPEQYVTVYFSDPVSDVQNLDGLIYLSTGTNVNLVVDGNKVKVYTASRQNGSSKIIVDPSVTNSIGYQLVGKYEGNVTFTSIKPDVEMIGDGVILPSTNGLIFPFKAVNLNAVNVKILKIFEDNIAQFLQVNQLDGTREMKRVGRLIYKGVVPLTSDKPIDYGLWNTFSLDLSKFIQTEPGAIYRVQVTFDKEHSLYPCPDETESKELEEDIALEDNEEEQAFYDTPNSYYYGNSDFYMEYGHGYNWREKENPCKKSYYMRNNHSIVKNVFASDLGIIAKGGNSKELIVAVTDIKTTEPLSGVDIEIYNLQQQLISTQTTDSEGITKISLESKPFLLMAKNGNQRGYLRIDNGSALSMSMFDVGGQENKKGVKGYIYGERGVWRPGDSLYLSFILEDKNRILPARHPVVFELFTPENQLYLRNVKTTALNGFYDFRTVTAQDAPTGNWLAKVKVGGSVFTKTIKVETVKPNRLKINLDFHAEVLKNTENYSGDLQVKWLHGAIARNLKSDVELILSEGKTVFDEYKDYTFDDPSKSFESEEKKIFEGSLDNDGKATVVPDISVKKQAPGMLKASFKVRAFEKGGDFSVDRFSLPYSPYRGYVGVKVPEGKGWNGALYSNEPNLIPIVTVDEDGKPVNREKVKIEIFDVRWRWWWERSHEDDLGRYVANKSSNLIKTDYVNTVNGKAMYEMNFGRHMYGRKLIRVTDPETGHSTGQTFYLTYKGWWNDNTADNPGGAEMLTFSTDKNKYEVGEKVDVKLPAATQGRALVSIESGSKVIETFWVPVNGEKESSFTFETTPEMTPNVYVHVSFIQPHSNMNNDMPIRLYGVQSISVEDSKTHLKPVIDMPEVLAPEKEVTIKVSEADGKRMTYTVAVVDEGLLDLTRFKTPNPWPNFYTREALGIRTWDMYKYVIGAFTGEMAGLLAVGGDDNINKKGGKKANRFKPVVTFLGPFELKSGKTNKHKFTMPNYVGSVRTMVVAGYDGAYGSEEKTTPVKKPLMVLASLPRVVGPAEKVKLPITVFAMDKKVKKVDVKVESNELFSLSGKSTRSITFDSEGDQVVTFDLDVAKEIGVGKVKVIATSGGERAEYEIEIDVRVPNPRVTDITEAMIEPGQVWEHEYEPVGLAGTNSGVVEISRIPSINLEDRLQYLILYPHGCIEQTTSSVFPQLHLAALLQMDADQKAMITENIIAGINRLKSFQLNNGGLSYWPCEYDNASEWGTNYAGHFMLEAQASGYNLPAGFLKNWISFQTRAANSWSPSGRGSQHHYYNSNDLIQAYRLYTLALAKKPALGAMNRMRGQRNLSVSAKWRLAAAYFLAGKPEVAKKLTQGLALRVEPYKELSYSYGSSERDQAMILETLTLMNEKQQAKNVLDEIAEKMGSGDWYSTQTTAYALLAIAKFSGAVPGGSMLMQYDYELNAGSAENVSTPAPVSQFDLAIKDVKKGKVRVRNKSDQTLFVKLQLAGIPLTGDQTSAENDLVMDIKYLDMEGNAIDPSRLEQGTDFIAEVKLQHPGVRINYKEMALTQIFPSGWEIRNTRMDQVASTQLADQPRYQDVRDDRVYSYFDINKSQQKTFRVILNAAYLGKFYLPTVYCEAMYDHEINARKAGKWVEVIVPGGNTGDTQVN